MSSFSFALMFGGHALLEEDTEEDDEDCEELSQKEARTQTRILCIGQDMVYNVSGGKHWTPNTWDLAVPCIKKHDQRNLSTPSTMQATL